jgi:hypothetical protein
LGQERLGIISTAETGRTRSTSCRSTGHNGTGSGPFAMAEVMVDYPAASVRVTVTGIEKVTTIKI